MNSYIVSLKDTQIIARETAAFLFEKPEGFLYRAGQFIDIELLDAPFEDSKGNIRPFSLASAPFEENLMIATRLTGSAFKRSLLEAGKEIKIKISNAMGALPLSKEDRRTTVFIAGGIGITPVRSMLLQALREKDDRQFVLLYSNKTPEDAAFLSELSESAEQNSNFLSYPTFTDKNITADVSKGYINEAMIRQHVPNATEAVYYITGSPGMVREMEKMLEEMHIPEEDIRSEEFSGY